MEWKMCVNFYATLRQIVGVKTVEFSVPAHATVRHLVDRMVTTYPGLRTELFNEQGHLHGHVHVLVNGRDVPFLEDELDTELKPDDRVCVFPAVGGG